MLKVRNLKKYFGGIKAVDGCDFDIEQGKITALIGPNGSGKTTVFNLISGIARADAGDIVFKNQNLIGKSVDEISNIGISRIFQQSRLFKNLSVRDNVLTAINNDDTKLWKNIFSFNHLATKDTAKIKKVFENLNITDIQDNLADNLSFGQKRLVELARTILNPHDLLLLDEPVAGVNPKIRNIIAKMLVSMKNSDKGVLLIEHDMTFTLSIADVIIVLDSGKIIARGSPSEIRKNDRVREAYLGYNKI